MDAGDILAQCSTTIDVLETAGELHDRLAHLAAPLLLNTLDEIERGDATYTPQDELEATSAPKLRKSDGFLDFQQPAYILADQIRGFWPWPGASAHFVSGKTGKTSRVTLALAEVVWSETPASIRPGTFDDDLNVVCGDGKLSIMKLKPAGAGLMTLGDFVNGWRVQPGDRFVKVEH
jgi:methionyl-tRNA formyltransferase